MNTFRISGRIIEADGGHGVSGVVVSAFDKEHRFDKLLEPVVTDKNGYFAIVYSKRNYRELFFEKQPELYIKVASLDGKELQVSRNRVHYLAGNRTEEVELVIPWELLNPEVKKFSIDVFRPEDFLNLKVTFINLAKKRDRPEEENSPGELREHIRTPGQHIQVGEERYPGYQLQHGEVHWPELQIQHENVDDTVYHLEHDNVEHPAYIIVEFPPQHIAEEAFFQVDENFPVQVENNEDITDADTGEELPGTPPCKTIIAGPSRLVFTVPAGQKVPYSTEGILSAIGQYNLKVAPTAGVPLLSPVLPKISAAQLEKRIPSLGIINAQDDLAEEEFVPSSVVARKWLVQSPFKRYLPQRYDAIFDKLSASLSNYFLFFIKPELSPPAENDTSIEVPYRLLISPSGLAAWAHANSPVISDESKRTELWHTRYGIRIGKKIYEEDNRLKTIRAIWTRDPFFKEDLDKGIFPANTHHYNPQQPDYLRNPFRMSLDAYDRENIVHLTSNFHIQDDDSPYVPSPVNVNQLMLSSMGAWMNVRGAWKPPAQLSVEEWRHIATMGRDHYVRVVYKGYLMPFGFKASLVKVTERKFHPQILHTLNIAGQLFQQQVNTLSSYFGDSLADPGTKKVLQGIAESYQRQVGQLVQDISEQGIENVNALIENSCTKFQNDAQHLLEKSRKSTQNKVVSLADKTREMFKGNISAIVGALEARPEVYVPGNIAWLRQRMYVVVRQREQFYVDSGTLAYNNQFPFLRMEITTSVTPDLDEPSLTEVVSGKGQSFFWPQVGGKRFQFHMTGHDLAGNDVEYTTPLIFVESSLLNYSNPDGSLDNIKYAMVADLLRQTQGKCSYVVRPALSGKSIMFAESVEKPGKTTFETEKMVFSFHVPDSYTKHKELRESLGDDDFPQFYPKVEEADIRIPALKHMVGNSSKTTIRYDQTFLQHGFNAAANKGEVFVNLVNRVDLDFSSQGDRSGGVAKPNIAISGLSRLMGPVAGQLSDLANLQLGNFNPEAFFGSLGAKIFGVINLWDIIEAVSPSGFLQNGAELLPKLLPDITKDGIEVNYNYSPKLKDWNNLFIASSKGKQATFELSAKFIAYNSGGADISIKCILQNFSIDLIGPIESFLLIHFDRLAFISEGGKKAEVDVEMGEIEFVGVLSFVEVLKDFIPLDGFSDPPSLDVTEKGITASFSLNLPTIAVGVFTLQNMSLGASLSLPFLVDPLSVRFNFCERQSPFLLTVSMLGGGGFFAITINPAGVQQLEASFEFGASVAVNFGVASGSLTVMAGIYIMMQKNPEKAELTGYLRMGGKVDVLGLISASIELYLSLTYEFSSGKCVGRATLTIEVEILFFSTSVEISCERKFAGSNGDPTFKDLMEPYIDPVSGEDINPWETYCRAYA